MTSATEFEELEETCAKLEAENTKLKEKLKEAWKEGYKAALRQYAWWKCGIEYVGCGVHTLKEVLENLEREKGDANGEETKTEDSQAGPE